MVKPVVAIVSLGVGAGAAAVIVLMQTAPRLLTNVPDLSHVPTTAALVVHPVAPPISVEVDDTAPAEPVIIKEVNVAARPPVRQAPPRRARPQVAPAPAPSVVPAPCVDGEYRMLEEHRGVRLMCPHPEQAP